MMQENKTRLWGGRILWVLSVPFMVVDAITHILKPEPVVSAFERLGYPISQGPILGVIVLALVVLYSVPRFAMLGAVLLTGYLGGAVAIHARVGDVPIFQVLMGVMLWASLFCRDERVTALWISKEI